jgi:hypothetical protein
MNARPTNTLRAAAALVIGAFLPTIGAAQEYAKVQAIGQHFQELKQRRAAERS